VGREASAGVEDATRGAGEGRAARSSGAGRTVRFAGARSKNERTGLPQAPGAG
jgi:hypothetical protein